MLYIYFLERKAHYSHSNKFSKHKNFLNIFRSCYNAYLDLENTIATLYPYFILKNCLVVLIYYSFSLIQTFFLLSIVLLVSLFFRICQCNSHFKNSSLTKSTLVVGLSHKKLVSFNWSSTTCDEEWSSKNISSTLNIGTQNFDLIGFLSYLKLLVYCMSWWFGGFEWFSIVSGFRFWVFGSFLFVCLSLCFLIFSLFFLLN